MNFAITWQNLLGAFLVGGSFGTGWHLAARLVGRILR